MIVAIGICPNDESLAFKQAQWIKELGGAKHHSALLVFDARCNPERVQKELEKSFDEVKTARCVDSLHVWPASANLTFSTAARHVEFYWPKAPYWFFFEPDCIPLTHHSFDLLEADHRQGKKPFSGARVEVEGVPLHLSGNAVYPAPLHKYAGEALLAHDIAFDVFAAVRIVPQAHWTDLIAHSWDRDYQTGKGLHSFPNWKTVEDQVTGPHPRAVFYHGDKSGSLIDRLREHLKGGEVDAKKDEEKENERQTDPDNRKPVLVKSAAEVEAKAAPLLVDIFIKSWEGDREWLSYCLRSIDKFCTGFRKIMLVTSDAQTPLPVTTPIQLLRIQEKEGEDKYLRQQVVKIQASQFTDADYFLHVDSDCIFFKPCTPETFFRDGKPYWLYSPYSKVDVPWKPITEKFIGKPVQNEFMRRVPCLIPRFVHEATAHFCLFQHGKTIENYIMEQPYREFSEFNAMGAIAWGKFPDQFTWINCHDNGSA